MTSTQPGTHVLVVVHGVFREEASQLPGLVAAASVGDISRARALGRHIRDYQAGLRRHQAAEDELCWPLLLARVDLEADLVLRMQAQHRRVSVTLEGVTTALAAWTVSAGGAERQRLVAALDAHREALLEHLDDEENTVLPIIERELTVAEWRLLAQRLTSGC